MALLSWLIFILIAVIAYEMIHHLKRITVLAAVRTHHPMLRESLIRLTHLPHILEPYSPMEFVQITGCDGARYAGQHV